MGLFFDVRTEADKKLLEAYDEAVGLFRDKVSRAMDAAADSAPSIEKIMRAAAEAVRQRPLPSEANSDPDALRRLTLSSVTVEMAFSKLQAHADSQETMNAAMGVVNTMRTVGKETTGRPEFRGLTQSVLQAVAAQKDEVLKEMDAQVLDLHVAALKKPAAARPPAPKPPKP